MDQQPKRTKWLTVRMSDEEYQQLENLQRQTTCASLSEYTRRAVLGKPVVMRYRNQSLDDFTTAMVPLRDDLHTIGTGFLRMVRRLQTLSHTPDLREWLLLNEQDKTRLFRQIETISQTINDTYQLWSRE